MADLLGNLYPASYNGIPFLMEAGTTQDGKKTVKYDFPFKNYTAIEEMGSKLRSINLKAIVTGDDFIMRRDALAFALKFPGIGVLIHPSYGLVTGVCTAFTIDETMTSVGIIAFDISFEETYPNIFPTAGSATSQSIISAAGSLASSVAKFFGSNFTTKFNKNIPDAASKSAAFNTQLNNNIAVASAIDQTIISDFSKQSLAFTEKTYSNIQSPTALGTAINNLLNIYNLLGTNYEQSYQLSAETFGFGSDDYYVDYGTAVIKERINNARTYNSTVNGIILANLYQNITLISYTDTDQLDTLANDLEAKYQWFIANNSLDYITLRSYESLRNQTRQFLNQLRVNVSKIIDITTPTVPLSVLLYKYYENFDYQSEIINLNNLTDVTAIEGGLKIVSL